ncbi:glycosyltransferase [Clostridium sp. PL3]|uniref:Glycosyltransferase n=1 Tax=Clostridium thailandense TaxID=2794346 RepID=A0A949TMG6_9CLOT|nr:glycosyltransferase family 4 protein [Clostridium thailandense]MBV7275085.1 glycosyltransferase [Clostridium thailandense]
MKILMISWEYPPKNVGGLSNHVFYLSHALSKKGHEVHVITCEVGTAPSNENNDEVFVHRVKPYNIETDDFIKWVMQLNFAIAEEATRIITDYGKFDLIHAHDWLSAFSAKLLKWSFKIPMVATIHATEYGRNSGIKTEMQRYISSAEWFLTYESWKVVACSNYMKQQVTDILSAPWDKVWVIPNGVNPEKFNFEFDWLNFRRNYARDDEKIVFYVGRHVFEKGIHILVEATQGIIERYDNTKIIIAGTGPMTEELKSRVRQMGIEAKVNFTGYMSDEDRDKMYRIANVAVFPSLYEPFGIVALEAMAAGCPIVVSDTGGLGEIVNHRVNGLKAISGCVESLIDNISELLRDQNLAYFLKKKALESVQDKYTWDKVSDLTTRMYEMVQDEAKGTEWETKISNEEKKGVKDKFDNITSKTIETLDTVSEIKNRITGKAKEKVNNLSDNMSDMKGKITDRTKEITDNAIEVKGIITNKTREAVVNIKEGISEVKEKINRDNKKLEITKNELGKKGETNRNI